MARFIVEGGTPLRGEIRPAGNKNEALPVIAAALLTAEPVTLHNVPRIRDVRGMLEIASALGAKVEELDPQTVRITAAELKSEQIPASLSREIRASLLFAAPLVARLKRARLGPPGGEFIYIIHIHKPHRHFLLARDRLSIDPMGRQRLVTRFRDKSQVLFVRDLVPVHQE